MLRTPATLLACLALLVAGTACGSTDESVHPGINDSYQGDIDVDEWVERFEREGRETYDQRHAIVQALGLSAGMDVADIGTGTGLFVPLFADAVRPAGRVWAVDIVPSFVDHVRVKVAEHGLDNVSVVLGTERSIELAPDSVDVAFMCDVYHHFEYPGPSLASIHRALRPGGELVVIDFRRIPGTSSDWVLDHVRAGEDQVIAEIEAAGFVRMDSVDLLEDNYMLRFRRS